MPAASTAELRRADALRVSDGVLEPDLGGGLLPPGHGAALALLGRAAADAPCVLAIAAPAEHGIGEAALGVVHLVPLDGASERAPLLGMSQGSRFGHALVALVDVDGDGVDDWAAGAPYHRAGRGPAAGLVAIGSGAGRGVIARTSGDGGFFGRALARTGDLDDDGLADVAVSAPLAGADGAGEVVFLSARTAERVATIAGLPGVERLGVALALGPDVDGNGARELVVGAESGTDGSSAGGAVLLVSVPAGRVAWEVTGERDGDHFGAVLARLPDQDGDGVEEVGATAVPATVRRGYVKLLSGASGAELATLESSEPGDGFGRALAVLETRKGLALVVGAPGAADGRGALVVFRLGGEPPHAGSGRTVTAGKGLSACGFALAALPDLDGDGVSELAVGCPANGIEAAPAAGCVLVVSGRALLEP